MNSKRIMNFKSKDMEETKKMVMPYIKARLGSYLKVHLNELTYATTKFTYNDVTDFIVSSLENYQGKGFYSFCGKMELKNPQKDGITEWASIKSRVYIEEGEDNEPKFSKVEPIYLY